MLPLVPDRQVVQRAQVDRPILAVLDERAHRRRPPLELLEHHPARLRRVPGERPALGRGEERVDANAPVAVELRRERLAAPHRVQRPRADERDRLGQLRLLCDVGHERDFHKADPVVDRRRRGDEGADV